MKKLFFISFVFLTLSVLSVFSVGDFVRAAGATLFLSPASGTYTVGKNFTVKVLVNSGGGVGINAAEGTINYDPSIILVSKLSTSGSIFKLWTTDPAYLNTEGKITFGGGLPGAYTGNAGGIFNITFTARKAGEAKVTFSSGIILAADGKGTNVFSGFGEGKYTIKEAEKAKPAPKKEPAKKEKAKGILPPLPEVSCATHPDENKWYADNDPEFSWKILSDLTGISFLIDSNPESVPDNESDGIIEVKKFTDVGDGVRYFHIKYQNQFGWGQVAHRKFMVDATPPEEFTVIADNGGDGTNPVPKLVFSTQDAASGLEYFDIAMGGEVKRVAPEKVASGYYRPPPLAPGEYKAVVAAVDKAGNIASSSVDFTVEPLKAPIITSIPKVMNKNDELIIQGTSFYPRVTVKIYLGRNKQETHEAAVTTDDNGNWTYLYKGSLHKGNYEVWAKIIDDRGAQSLDSTRYLLTVVSPSIIETFGWLIIIVLLVVIAVLILMILYQRKRFKEEKIRIKTEANEVQDKVRKIFSALREEVNELVELADKKPGFSEAERRIKEKLQESLDISEEFINKEVEDVEKEIKLDKDDAGEMKK